MRCKEDDVGEEEMGRSVASARQHRRDRDIRGNRRHSSWVTDRYEPRRENARQGRRQRARTQRRHARNPQSHRDWHERARTHQHPMVHDNMDKQSRTLTPMRNNRSVSVSPTERRDKQKHRLLTPRTSNRAQSRMIAHDRTHGLLGSGNKRVYVSVYIPW